eukprot:GSMAST32.ASY1.ANO1.2590.1 assembled CDS
MSITEGGDFHNRVRRNHVVTKSTLVPKGLFKVIHYSFVSKFLCHCVPFVMLFAARYPSNPIVRYVASIFFSLYCLAETSVTTSHRDYTNMYTSWALAVLGPSNDDISAGVALGVSIVMLMASGWAKLLIGGIHWWNPSTLRNILTTYSTLQVEQYGPLSHFLNLAIRSRPWMLRCMAFGTIVFECFQAPLSLFIPSNYRYIMIVASIAMHLGIAIVQSFIIGIAFLPNCASYCFGFGSSDIHIGSTSWYTAVLIIILWAIGTGVCSMKRKNGLIRLLPENWPCTPFALFAWNGEQWYTLFQRFVDSDTRLVIYNNNAVINLVGMEVTNPNPTISKKQKKQKYININNVFDAWGLLLGETLCHSIVYEHDICHKNWNIKKFMYVFYFFLQKNRIFFS